jgi:hypothetical protein
MRWNLGQTVPARAGDPTADTTESAYPTHFAKKITGTTLRIGYEALALSGMPDNHTERVMYPDTGRITRMKLLLEPRNHVHETRMNLMEQLGCLQESGHITEARHVLRDFVVEILRHTKCVLQSQGYLSDPYNGTSILEEQHIMYLTIRY